MSGWFLEGISELLHECLWLGASGQSTPPGSEPEGTQEAGVEVSLLSAVGQATMRRTT